jgi:hypothetical protein
MLLWAKVLRSGMMDQPKLTQRASLIGSMNFLRVGWDNFGCGSEQPSFHEPGLCVCWVDAA